MHYYAVSPVSFIYANYKMLLVLTLLLKNREYVLRLNFF